MATLLLLFFLTLYWRCQYIAHVLIVVFQYILSACLNRPADVYFVLDSSSSIWIHDFQTNVLGFVRDVIDIFDVSRESTRVGVITFSDTPRTVFGLDSHVHKDELLKVCASYKVFEMTSGSTQRLLACIANEYLYT